MGPEVIESQIPEENLQRAASELLEQIRITKGSRFNAHRRLLGKHIASQFALAVLSIYTIAASIATLVLPSAQYPNLLPAMSAGTIVASVFVLVQSLLESAKNYQLRSHLMFKCGEKLSMLYNECRATINVGAFGEIAYLGFVESYGGILADYSENHSETDYNLFVLSRSRHKPATEATVNRAVRRALLQLWSVVQIWGASAVYISAPPLAVAAGTFWLKL